MATTAGYGRWPSPLAAGDVARAKVSLSELCSDGDCALLARVPPRRGRPGGPRAGRRRTARSTTRPTGVSIRSRVHEYGGGAVCLVPGAVRRRVRLRGPGRPAGVVLRRRRGRRALPAPGHAAGAERRRRRRAQVHRHGGLERDGGRRLGPGGARGPRPRRRPARHAAWSRSSTRRPSRPSTLLEGHDFYGRRAVDPAGDRLAVVAWDHPDMPWDASACSSSPLGSAPAATGTRSGRPGAPWPVAGGPGESVGQPAWSRDGRCASSRTGAAGGSPTSHPGGPGERADRPRADRCGGRVPRPDWVLGQSHHGRAGRRHARRRAGPRPAATPWSCSTRRRRGRTGARSTQPCVSIAALCAHGDGVALIGATPEAPPNVWVWRPGRAGRAGLRGRRPRVLGRGGRGAGRALLADRALGAPRPRHALPARRWPGHGRPAAGRRRSWSGATAARRRRASRGST